MLSAAVSNAKIPYRAGLIVKQLYNICEWTMGSFVEAILLVSYRSILDKTEMNSSKSQRLEETRIHQEHQQRTALSGGETIEIQQ